MVRFRAPRPSSGFFGGMIVGALLTYFLFFMESFKVSVSYSKTPEEVALQSESPPWSAAPESDDELSSLDEVTWPVRKVIISRKNEDESLASSLKRKVRILCCVMTSREGLQDMAVHIRATWGRRCNNLLFMIPKSSESIPGNLSLPVVELDVPEGLASSQWTKTKAALMYINNRNPRDADWFFITTDFTFAVMENMRYLLKDLSPDTAVYLGRRFKPYVAQGYMSGGAGYVLSRAAVKRVATYLIQKPSLCPDSNGGMDDVLLGTCLQMCGVKAVDTRDELDRQRFHPVVLWEYLIANGKPEEFWLNAYDYYPTEMGPECCSDYSITFNYMPPYMLYLLDFFVYHLNPYGIAKNCELLEDI